MFDLTPFDRARRGIDPFFSFREIDDFEKRFFGRPLPMLRTDIRETEDAYILESELPGFQPEEIRVSVKNNRLTVCAQRNDEGDDDRESGGYIRRERVRGSVCRSFDVTGVLTDKISASFHGGILILRLPKANTATDTEQDVPIET